MKPAERFGFFGILGLALAAVGIVAPIVWDRYRSRTEIELQILSTTTVVEPNVSIDKLRLMYDTMLVPSVSRIEIALVNTGRTPITSAQVVDAPTVRLDSGQLLDVQLIRTDPEGVKANYAVDSTNHQIRLTFPLLNAGDAVYLSALASTSRPSITASARIAGIRELVLRDRRQPTTTRPPLKLTWSFYVVATFTGVVLLSFFAGLYTAAGENALRTAAKSGVIRLPRGVPSANLRQLIREAFGDFAGPETRPAAILLAADTGSAPLTDDRTNEVEGALLNGLTTMTPAAPALVTLALLAGVGIWFVVTRLL